MTYDEMQSRMDELHNFAMDKLERDSLITFQNSYTIPTKEDKLKYKQRKFDGIYFKKPSIVNLKSCTCENY